MFEDREKKTVKKLINGEEINVEYVKMRPINEATDLYPGFKPEKVLLKKGSRNGPESYALDCDIIFERDVAITLRDGITIYADIFRPVCEEKVPGIIAWSPYGKHNHSIYLPWGVPESSLSNLQKQEGPDPGFWCKYGYAVINPDSRGVYMSEGDSNQFGKQECEDGYDVVEWVAAQPWCSGKIGMSGNSYVAIGQICTASEQPPHLTAIAPWEALNDHYRDIICRGGIPDYEFNRRMIEGITGNGYAEDTADMLLSYPLMNAYWEDKSLRVEDIRIPAYVTASYISKLHTQGTFDTFERLPSKEKWLRVHNTHEWPDLYEYQDDLRSFFDYYLKGIDNDWPETPRVRISILDPGGKDIVNRPENEFPIARTEYRNIYLSASNMSMSYQPASEESFVDYISDDGQGKAVFTYTFEEEAETTGFFSLRLWVESDTSDDMDLFVYALKADQNGELLPPMVFGAPFSGFNGAPQYTPEGRLRVSHREIDEEKSKSARPYLTHKNIKKIKPGEIVEVNIPMWPVGMLYHKGQKLQVIISGFELNMQEWPDCPPIKTINRGRHIIHTGGKYDSFLTIPYITKK